MEWMEGRVGLSQHSEAVRRWLLDALRTPDHDDILNILDEFDEPSLREGVDLIMAGMLEHEARSKSLRG
jgi:hypothetical protein